MSEKKNFPIVRLMSWGTPDAATWARVINNIAKGESFGIWFGHWRQIPSNWVEGKCALRVKVGKKRKLVRGILSLESEGWDERGDLYSFRFSPRPRILSRKLHPALYECIFDRKAS